MAANGLPKVRFGVAWLRRRISERVVLICTCCRDLGGFLPAFFAARHPVGCFCPRPRWSYRARHENACFPSTRVDDTSPMVSGSLADVHATSISLLIVPRSNFGHCSSPFRRGFLDGFPGFSISDSENRRERERERERLKFRELSLLFEVESSLRTTSSISAVFW